MADVPTYTLDSIVTDVNGVDEVQNIAITGATAGNFTLTFDGETTGNIAHNASAQAVADALLKLGPFNAGDVSVTAPDGDNYRVTFGGDYAAQNVATLVATSVELKAGETPVTPVVTTVTAGKTPSETDAIKRGTGLADRTAGTSPLAGKNPITHRADNPTLYD